MSSIVLSGSSRVRYATGSFMYFSQGIPAGLLSIAIPAWLASQGVSASDIATYLAVITLPWAFKLVTGPLMDRYEFLPMGRRRPWVLGAQVGLSVSLVALMLVEDPPSQMGLLMLIGLLVNSFTATQDVAVDGMAIDLTPVREQGRLNAFMSFGKAIGWSVTAAVSGVMLTTVGLNATALLATAVSGVGVLAMLFVLERPGERTLPWTSGDTASVPRADVSFRDVFKSVNKVLWGRASLIVMAIMFFDGLIYGYGQALMPIAAINLFGYTTAQWSQLVAMMGLVGAVVSLGVGPLIDKAGAKRMLIVTVALVGVHALTLAQTQQLWQDTTYVRVMLSIYVMMIPVVMVATIALAMAICSSSISATQFAVYMSVANLGHALGSKVYGMVADKASYVQSYTMMSVLVAAMIVILLFHRHKVEEEIAEGRKKRQRRYTISMAGGEGGSFWSGAMRCPKCRADMEQVDYEGTEIDRCTICKGIWFDAGEIDLLRDRQAAAAVDVGDASVGRKSNKMDDYQCPRCSGTMVRVVDPQQRHIWFETCSSCNGSFLDAGELRDLSTVNIADFFRDLATPERR